MAAIRLDARIRSAIEAPNATASEAAHRPKPRHHRRSLPTPRPEPVRGRLAGETQALGEAFDEPMWSLGAALKAGATTPTTNAVDVTFAYYAKRSAGCAGRNCRGLGNGDAERFFGL